jgi:hypothetical protein
MNFTFTLLLFTFIGHLIITGLLTRYIRRETILKWLKAPALFFLIYDCSFYLGYSFRGDYIDYILFSLEYLCFCLLIASSSVSKNIFVKILRISGYFITISVVILSVTFGFIITVVMAQELDCVNKSCFNYGTQKYEVRRFESGFVTQLEIKQVYDTYQVFGLFPFEKRIDRTILYDLETDGPFSIVDSSNARRYLILQFVGGDKYIKQIK